MIITDIIDIITSWLTGFWTLVSTTITAAIEIFYVSGVDGGITVIGTLALFGLAVGLVYYGLGFVTRLFKK